MKRIPCCNHILNNNLKYSIKKCDYLTSFFIKVKKFIKCFKFKGIIIDYLNTKNLPWFVLPPSTRWLYHYHMIDKLLKLKEHIPQMCDLLQIDNITVCDYSLLASLKNLFELYKTKIELFERRDSKISSIIPGFLVIFQTLDNNTDEQIDSLKNYLIYDLKLRTKFIFDSNHYQRNFSFNI